MNGAAIDATRGRWADVAPEIEAHFGTLWRRPELPMMEFHAAASLGAWLAGHGFQVQPRACGLPTAFIARYARGSGPAIGVLAEYDALPGQGNLPTSHRAADANRAGHACGHNQIGAANVGAAVAARHAMEPLGLAGSIVVLGCPAEELLWGKIALLERGAFDGLDALLTSHGDYQNGALSRPCLSCVSSELVFTGVSSHGGAARTRNALEGAELTVQTLERLDARQFPDALVGHVFRVGGLMPSITPDEARLWLTVRHERFERAEAVYRDILAIARSAAQFTHTAVAEQLVAASRGYLPNDALARVLYRNLEVVGPPRWSADDLDWMAELSRACSPGLDFDLHRDLALLTTGCDPYGQDDGEASWRIPLARANWALPAGVPLHMWGTTALSGHPAGVAGPLMASEALALTVVDLLAQPATLTEARRELTARVAGRPLSPPRCGGFDVLTQRPESFWDATWVSHDTLEGL